MAKKKFYAVAKGRNPGVYTSWPEAEIQVKGYPGAKFKGFASLTDAKEWVENPPDWQPKKRTITKKNRVARNEILVPSADCIEIYTDGGAINNPGPGGYGVVILVDDTSKELSGGYRYTTNNRMELMACIKGIEALPTRKRKVALFSDSKYVVNGFSKGWAKGWRKRKWMKSDGKPAVNPDLWKKLLDLTEGLNISFQWVKGHAGHPLNERCDQLAVQSARGTNLVEDKGYRG